MAGAHALAGRTLLRHRRAASELRHAGTELHLLNTLTTFGAPRDVTPTELFLEAFYPADSAAADALRALNPDDWSAGGGLEARVDKRSCTGNQPTPKQTKPAVGSRCRAAASAAAGGMPAVIARW